ncbi:MAG: hypothetical protein JW739_05250 [Opitutales bacterium]|nr:hypothetical protein [Opitutales bacterium]
MNGRLISLTLFSAITSLEEDLKEYILLHHDPALGIREYLSDKIYDKCIDRSKNDDVAVDLDIRDLVVYLDFNDVIETVYRNKELFPKIEINYFKSKSKELAYLAGVRNKVMHSRPLDVKDYPTCIALFDFLSKSLDRIFNRLKDVLNKSATDPSWVLKESIELSPFTESVFHNLPIVDTNDTGFIGRKKELDQLNSWFRGPYPVAAIIGEGGIGKTSLALNFGYELLNKIENKESDFDGIIWVSSKTNKLTHKEIESIDDALSSSKLVFEAISDKFDSTSEDKINSTISILSEFKILLIIDNLETILDGNIQTFLTSLKGMSKVLITSRIGVGSMNLPIRVEPMEVLEGISLLRAYSQALRVDIISKSNNSVLERYVRTMKCNPGYIKWFVTVVNTGVPVESVLVNKKKLFLEFCMSNVYKYLKTPQKKILKYLTALDNRYSMGELSFLTKLKFDDLAGGLNQLFETNFLKIELLKGANATETVYSISPLCREYLLANHPYPSVEYKAIVNRKNEMERLGYNVKKEIDENPYSINAITIRNDSDLIIVNLLQKALLESKRGEYKIACARLDEAKDLAADFFEIYRVGGFIHAKNDSIALARQNYEVAMELNPDSSSLLLMYAGFVSRYENDYRLSRKLLDRAIELDPDSVISRIELARIYMLLNEYPKALELIKSINIKEYDYSHSIIYHHLKMKILENWAYSYAKKKDYANSIKRLEDFVKCINEIKDGYLDFKMKSTLRLAASLVRKVHSEIMSCMPSVEMKNQAIRVKKSIYTKIGWNEDYKSEENDRYDGQICRIMEDKKYGYIHNMNDRSDDDIFFFFRDCDFMVTKSLIGENVVYSMGMNASGYLARCVCLKKS